MGDSEWVGKRSEWVVGESEWVGEISEWVIVSGWVSVVNW